MLATSPWSFSHTYIPQQASPLSPRSVNLQMPMPMPIFANMSKPRDAKKPLGPSNRQVKANPMMRSRDATAAKRRDMFLKKVQQDRDEQRWEARGEQIMRLDYVSQRRRYEAEKDRDAPPIYDATEEDDESLPEYPQTPYLHPRQQIYRDPQQQSTQSEDRMMLSQDDEVEVVAQQEDQELEALLALAEEQEREKCNDDAASVHFGSDIDDYDQIFDEYLSSQGTSRHASFDVDMDDVMDTSGG